MGFLDGFEASFQRIADRAERVKPAGGPEPTAIKEVLPLVPNHWVRTVTIARQAGMSTNLAWRHLNDLYDAGRIDRKDLLHGKRKELMWRKL